MLINIKYDKPEHLKSVQQSAYIKFNYNKYIVDTIRMIYPRYYDVNTRTWEIPYDYVSYLQENLSKYNTFNIIGKPISDKTYNKKEVKEYTLPKQLKTKLYDYQKDVFNECMTYNRYLLLLSQGLGKTVVTQTAIIKHKELNHINNALVIVCVNGLKYTWKNEFKKHFKMNVKVLGDRLNKKGYYEVKSNEDKLYDLKHLDKNNYVYITNIESLRDKKILEELKKLFKKGIFSCIVVDECHKVKSSGSIQGRALLTLSKYTKYMYELTGTIITNSPVDLYVPLKCMKVEESNFNSFKNHYCTMGGFGGYQIVGYKHMDELQSKLLSCSVRLRKEDVLDLPEKTYIDEYVDMGTKQRKIYEDVKKAIVEDIDNVMLSVNPLSQLIRLRQASTDTSILSSIVNESAKYDRALELIKDIIDNNESVVVFSELSTVINNFYKLLPYKKVAVVTGKIKDREHQIDMFMNDDECHIILGTEALQTGYTLTKANNVIFLDEPWTAAQKSQAEDRCHRISQHNNVSIITLMCKNTIDEYIHNLISRKAVVSDALIDNKYNIKDKNVINYIITGEGNL